jgi:selenocysteine-specific elongation factor
MQNQVQLILKNYHKQYPLRIGIAREEMKSRLKLDQKMFLLIFKRWQSKGDFQITNSTISLPDHVVTFSQEQLKDIDELVKIFKTDPYNTPGMKDCARVLGEEVLNALVSQGMLIPVLNDVVFLKEHYLNMLNFVQNHLRTKGEISAAEFRDVFKTSRRYALGFLEYIDSIGITIRDGDVRKLRPTKK